MDFNNYPNNNVGLSVRHRANEGNQRHHTYLFIKSESLKIDVVSRV